MGPGDRAPPTYNVRHTIFFQSIQSPGIEEPQNQPEPPAPVRLAIAVCRALGTVTQKVLTLIKAKKNRIYAEIVFRIQQSHAYEFSRRQVPGSSGG
jgi:hypothetical protein